MSARSWSWTDVAVVAGTAAAGVLIMLFAAARGTGPEIYDPPLRVTVRVPRPQPEVAARLRAGNVLRDERGRAAGTVVDTSWVPASGERGIHPGLEGPRDLRVDIRATRLLPCRQDLPGFLLQPAPVRPGVWCLLATEELSLSGLVIRADPEKRAP